MSESPKSIILLAYQGLQTLDLSGPLDAFAAANDRRPGAYGCKVVSLDGGAVTSESGLRILPDASLAEVGEIDTLMIPGGAGLRQSGVADGISGAVRRLSPQLRRIVSICTGIYGVAQSGLLDGRRATTHWRFAADVAMRFPAIKLDSDAIFVKDGPVYSSAGITAAIDLSLALIEEDYGPRLSLAVARDLVVYIKRAGGQQQYSEPLRFQAGAADRFSELAGWICDHLGDDLSIETLAAQAGVSPRHFTRRFKQIFGVSPSQQVELMRLDRARDHLTAGHAAIERIAAEVGFKSADAFRRAFDRRFGLSPSNYRQRFSPLGESHAA